MSSFTNLFSMKAPAKLTVKKKMVWYIGAIRFKLDKGGKAFYQALLEAIHGSNGPWATTHFITPSLSLNFAVGWNNQSCRLSRMCLNGFQ